MKNLRNATLILFAAAFFMQLAFVTPAFAQDYGQQAERERLARVMDANANIEEFRQEYNNYLTELESVLSKFDAIPAVHKKFAESGFKSIEQLAVTRQNLANMKTEDLAKLREVYAKVVGWRDAPRALNSILKPELRQRIQNRSAAKNNEINTSSAIIPDTCPDPNLVPSNSDIAVTKAAEIAADLVMELLPTDGITIIGRAIAAVARAGVKAGVLAAETLKAIHDDCTGLDATAVQDIVNNAKTEIINNDNDNKTTIISNDNSNNQTVLSTLNTKTNTITNAITNAQTSINETTNASSTAITTAITDARTAIINNDNTNKTQIVNNDNSNATTLNTAITNARNTIVQNDNTNTTNIINNSNANTATLNTAITNAKTEIINVNNANTKALMDAMLRSQIEADLASEPSAVKVAWYMTPTAKGGHLDLVQQIVTQTLANIVAAGGSIGTAQSFLDQANADKAAGRFKAAYDNYRKAYKAAAN